MPVLVVSGRHEDHQRVRESLCRAPWLVVEARTWEAALSLSTCLIFPVILYDRDLLGPEGKLALWRIMRGLRSPSVVLISDRLEPDARDRLPEEGCSDILVRPLQEDDICAVLESAYRQWEDGATGLARLPLMAPRSRAAS